MSRMIVCGVVSITTMLTLVTWGETRSLVPRRPTFSNQGPRPEIDRSFEGTWELVKAYDKGVAQTLRFRQVLTIKNGVWREERDGCEFAFWNEVHRKTTKTLPEIIMREVKPWPTRSITGESIVLHYRRGIYSLNGDTFTIAMLIPNGGPVWEGTLPTSLSPTTGAPIYVYKRIRRRAP